MFRNRLYYGIKPLLPARLRLGVRGYLARRARTGVADVWPISPGSEKAPEGWPGWPEGKKFAVVLTHDVEGQRGLDRIQKVIDLEKSLGFKSSFNLIPEGEYRVTPELRKSITDQGFEVGVHDLYHNGKLFLNRGEFAKNAGKINQYLKDWGASGFRSGFMLHNLDWIHDLNVAYDLSTFDTDPFEPQPYGQHTIFPFWVTSGAPSHSRTDAQSTGAPITGLQTTGNSTGYVELPYTLPQDSTLFLILKEEHPDIWMQKLDWIAKHGGMVLLNVHPDYLRFKGEARSALNYSYELYERFLRYLNDRYHGQYWQPIAREMTKFVLQHKPRTPHSPRRICMVTHSSYTTDARVTRYAEALASRGDHVDVLALQHSPDEPRTETIRGVNLIRLRPRFAKNEKSKLSFLMPVLKFLWAASVWVAREHSRRKYDLLHIHNIPDFVVFAGLYPRLTGAKVILDIHDIVPEFYASKFGVGPDSLTVRALKCMEFVSSKVANHVIIANHLWLDTYRRRTGANGKCSVFINNVDTEIFKPRPKTRTDGKFIIIFPGGLQWHQGLDIAIRAFAKVLATLESPSSALGTPSPDLRPRTSDLGSPCSDLRPRTSDLGSPCSDLRPPTSDLGSPSTVPSAFSLQPSAFQCEFHIVGDGNMREQLIALTKELGLEKQVLFFKPVPVRQVAELMANADLGVVPKRADSFGNEAYSTKIMEFMSLGIPVVVSSTKIDRFYFDDSVVRFFPSGDEEALAEAIISIIRDRNFRDNMISNASQYAQVNSWVVRKSEYVNLVHSIITLDQSARNAPGLAPNI